MGVLILAGKKRNTQHNNDKKRRQSRKARINRKYKIENIK